MKTKEEVGCVVACVRECICVRVRYCMLTWPGPTYREIEVEKKKDKKRDPSEF